MKLLGSRLVLLFEGKSNRAKNAWTRKCEGKRPGENTPQLAVAQNDLNAGGHYQCPLYGLHGLEEPLLNHRWREKKNLQITHTPPPTASIRSNRQNGQSQATAAAHLMTVGYPRKRRVLDDGHYRDDERVGAADDRRQPGPEERLQQRVYPRHEQQRLHHPDPVPLQTATPVPKRKGKKKRPKTSHHQTDRCCGGQEAEGGMAQEAHIVAAHHGNQHRRDHHRRAQRQYVVLEAQYDRLA
jgi:hypothetical protein